MTFIIMGHRKNEQNIIIIGNILLTDTFVYRSRIDGLQIDIVRYWMTSPLRNQINYYKIFV